MKIPAKSIIPPLLSLVIIMLGNGFFNTFVSLRISQEGFPYWINGIVHSAYYIGIMLGCLCIERLIKSVGHICSFAILASFNAVLIVLLGHLLSPNWWIFFRFFVAIFSPSLGIMFSCTYFLMYDKAGIDEIVPSALQDQFKGFFV